MRWLIGLALVALVSGLPTRGAAQVFSTLDANVAGATYDGYLPSAVYTLGPSVEYVGGPFRTRLDGALSEFQTGHLSGVLNLNAVFDRKLYGPLRWELGGEGSSLWYRSLPPVLSGLVAPRLRFDRGPFTAWAGGAVGGTDNSGLSGMFVSRVDEGMSLALPHLTPTFTVATIGGIAHYTDFSGTIQSEVGPLGVTVTGGTRVGELFGSSAPWINAELRITVINGLAIVMGAGSYPADPVRGAPRAHLFGGGIRISNMFRVRQPRVATPRYSNGISDVMPDARTLRLAAKPNARVELMADFTEWLPVAMVEVRPGFYQLTLKETIRSGPHRVNIRVDGGDWDVPVELPPVRDDFGGSAGSLVVP